MDLEAFKSFMIALIDEEFAPRAVPLSKRWAGGTIVLKPDNDTQPKEIPLEIFFKKILGIRESLRVLEQKINNHAALGPEDRTTLQAYVTKCYGSLTTFNVLFKDDKDKFVGSGSGTEEEKPKMTVGEAKRRLGMGDYSKD